MADYDEEYMAEVAAIRAARKLKAAQSVPEPVVELEEEEAVEPPPSVIAMPKDGGGANPS